MSRSIKKRAVVLSVAAIISVSSCFAATNKLVDVRFEESNGKVLVTVYSQKGFANTIKAVKAGQYYNIILPNVDKGSFKKLTPGGQIEFVRFSSVESADGSYTKLQIKPVGNVVISAKGEMASSDVISQVGGQSADNQNLDVHNPDEEHVHGGHGDLSGHSEPEISSQEEYLGEEPSVEEEPVENVSQKPNVPAESITLPVSQSPVLDEKPRRSHTSEIFNILIGSMAVLLVVILLYLNGKTRMKQLCGDMGVSFDDDDEEKTKKEEAKRLKKEEQERKRIEKEIRRRTEQERKSAQKALKAQKAAEAATAKMLKKVKLVDMEATSVSENTDDVVGSRGFEQQENPSIVVSTQQPKLEAQSQSVEDDEDDYDLDEFLEAFADQDEDETETQSAEEQKNSPDDVDNDAADAVVGESPLDGLIDDVIATQGITFSEADLEALQKGLQSEVSAEVVEQVLASKQTEEEKPKKQYTPLTLEEFDEKNPTLSENAINEVIGKTGVKFDKADRKAVYEVMSADDMPASAIQEARIRKEKLDRENLSHYEKEQGFAFTLIKTDDEVTAQENVVVEDEYPDIRNTDFSGDAILQEFSLVSTDTPMKNEAPSLDDIEAAMANVKLSEMTEEEAKQYEKPEKDSILSEFTLIKPDVEPKKKDDDGFSSTVFTSMEDIENQFKALGIDFDSNKTSEAEDVALNVMNEVSDTAAEEQRLESESLTETEIYSKCAIDDSSELCIAYYEGKTQLIAVRDNAITPLYEFEQGKIPSKLSARAAEETENGKRYIVRAEKYKFVVEVNESKIEMVLVL